MNGKDDFIVVGVNQKDKKIWRDFYDRYYAALCSYVSKFLSVSDAVEDLVQEVFISVWEGKRIFSDSKELTNYLYRACYNNALLYIRNNQIRDSILSSLPSEEDFEDEEMIYALTVKEEAIRQLYFYIEAGQFNLFRPAFFDFLRYYPDNSFIFTLYCSKIRTVIQQV